MPGPDTDPPSDPMRDIMLNGRSVWVMAKGYLPDEGGMQTYAREVAEAYVALGARVTVFTQTSAGPGRTRIAGVRVIDIGAGHGLRVPLRLIAAIRAERAGNPPDLVHATTWRTAIPPLLNGLPFLVTVHGREIMYARGLAMLAMRRVLARATRIVAVSAFTRARLLDRLPALADRAVVAWNGVSRDMHADADCGTTAPRPRIMTLCRLEPRKNVAAAIAAAARCTRDGMTFDYDICGRGPEMEALRRQIEAEAMSDRIRLHGFVSDEDARRLYAKADIFLHPQIAHDGGRDFEGFGIAIADAMAARTACIVGDAGGTPELVRNGQTGLIIDGHDPEALAAALGRLIANPVARNAMAEAAASWAATHFDWQRHCRIAAGLATPDPD